MIDARGVPRTLWAFTVLVVFSIVVRLVVDPPPVVAPFVLFVAVVCLWLFFLLKAVRWLWIISVILIALLSVADLASGRGPWYAVVVGAIQLSLLLLPETRRFFVAPAPTLS
jgi:hypothetical protein